MKIRTYLVAAVILAAIIVIGLNFKPKPPGGGAKPKETAEIPSPPPVPVFDASTVDEISISSLGGGSTVELRKAEGGWVVSSLEDAPADAAKVERFVADVFQVFRMDAEKVEGIDAAEAGLADNQAATVVVRSEKAGVEKALGIGFAPAGEPLAAYVMAMGGPILLQRSDLRGDLGIWENAPSPVLRGDHWLSKTAFTADPSDVVKIEFADGYQRLTLEKGENGWRLTRGGPKNGQELFDAAAATDWAKALTWLVPGVVADSGAHSEDETAEKNIVTVGLADGSSATVTAWKGDSGLIPATISTRPGLVYHMPEWRFNRYFRRFFDIFPGRNPRFDAAEVRFADIRRDGDSVKFALRDRAWSAVGVTYPLRIANLRTWIEAVSRWRPDGFAPDGPSPRVPQDAPTIEVILASGDVRQYRLGGETGAGRERYVLVDGNDLFLTDPASAEALFPQTTALFYLGAAFLDVDPDAIREASVFEEGMERPAVVRRDEAGNLLIETDDGVAMVYPETAKTFLDAPLLWRVAGAYKGDAAVFDAPRLALRFTVNDAERTLVLAPPSGGRYPALRDGRDAFLIDSNEVDSWLTVFHVARPLPAEPPVGSTGQPQEATEPEEIFLTDDPVAKDEVDSEKDAVAEPEAENTGVDSIPAEDVASIPSDESIGSEAEPSESTAAASPPLPVADIPESVSPDAHLDSGVAADEPPDDSGGRQNLDEAQGITIEAGEESRENDGLEVDAAMADDTDLENMPAY